MNTLFIISLLAVLPTLSFGLKCYQCHDGCYNGTLKSPNPCRKPSGNKTTVLCTKAEGYIKLGGEDNGTTLYFGSKGCGYTGSEDLITDGCKTVKKPEGPKEKSWPFAGDVNLCGCNTDYCNGQTKIHVLVGFTFGAAVSSTVLHKYFI